MPGEEFVRRLRNEAGEQDVHYAFWLGAGCSITSGIPAAGSLVKDFWLPRLCRVLGGDEDDLDGWAAEKFPGYDQRSPAEIYGPVMERLFIQPDQRQREVERLCSGKNPGFGYAVLASLMSREDGLFNVALTTNFDDLIADAMYVFGPDNTKPLVIQDEALARFIRPSRTRPLVVKVHGDFRLSPRNTVAETAELKKDISDGIGDLLHDRGAIFVGYGGNDKGIAEVFKRLPREALPLGIWWASREEPTGALREWLDQRKAIWVDVPGFDELMLLFKSEFEIPNPNSSKFDQLFSNYVNTYKRLQREVDKIPASDPSAGSLRDAAARADELSEDWTAQYLAAARVEDDDPDRAEKIYRAAIADHPGVSMLHVGLGSLYGRRTKYEAALVCAERAFELTPDDSAVIDLYGTALAVNNELGRAAEVLTKGVRTNPSDVDLRCSLGYVLAEMDRMEEAGRQADAVLELKLDGADDLNLVAALLSSVDRNEQAVELFSTAIELSPQDANMRTNFAASLLALGRSEEALKQLELAEADLPPSRIGNRVEINFYRLIIAPEPERSQALSVVKSLLGEGARLPTWDLSTVVRYAERTNHPDAYWLATLASVLGGQEDASVLDGWPLWVDA
jgi:Flp pilus assembly protein TadD